VTGVSVAGRKRDYGWPRNSAYIRGMAYQYKAKEPRAYPAERQWEFRSRDELVRFWAQVRNVPRRSNGRTPKQYESYYLGLYLQSLANHELLSYPIEVVEGESPDFMLTWKSGETTGLEITRATDQELQRWLTRGKKDDAKARATMASFAGYAGDQVEHEWCSFVREAIEKKLAKLRKYRDAARHDLLVVDDTRAGAGDRRKVLALLDPWARELKREESKLGKISVVASLDVLYDIGGESRIFPYVHWSAPELDDVISNESFSERAELAGRVTVERAIREPSLKDIPSDETPVPGYYVDKVGRIVRRASDGRRFEVRLQEDGSEVVVRELPSV
jgi:hypothetical protein